MPNDQPQLEATNLGKSYIEWPNIERAAHLALDARRGAGEIMTYHQDGWVVREYPGHMVVRLAPIDAFRAEDFPVKS